ncbi:uncharacterized protein [Anabrus simplex]|uniref:uncharacterized protein n=1 Tax=Anabrus simplex TaxID=316456 RepID=UPI0035A2C420
MESHPAISNEEWSLAVRRLLGDSVRFDLLSIDWGGQGSEVVGFQGDHFRVKLSVSVDGQQPQEFNMFVKTVPVGSDFKTVFVVATNAYVKEISIYTSIFEEFRKYGLIPQETPWAPKCFLTRSDLLVMEDLISAGFRMFNKFEYMDFPHCKIVLSTLARLHAASIIYEEKEKLRTGRNCSLNELFPVTLFETMYPGDPENVMSITMRTGIKSVLEMIKVMENYGMKSKYLNTILQSFKQKAELIFEYVKPSNKYRNVVSHGDLWPNNLMFRYAENSGVPEEVRLVDYQMVRYAPPALDVMSFLHLVTNREFRRNNLETLLSLYHGQLVRVLERHDVNVIPWEEFLESCRHYAQAARIIVPLIQHAVLLPDHLLATLLSTKASYEKFILKDRGDVVVQCFKDVEYYKERLTGDIEELIEFVVLGLKSD